MLPGQDSSVLRIITHAYSMKKILLHPLILLKQISVTRIFLLRVSYIFTLETRKIAAADIFRTSPSFQSRHLGMTQGVNVWVKDEPQAK